MTKPLDKLYALYLEGRKKGAPQGYIDYFSVGKLLLDEIDLATESNGGTRPKASK